jgi:uncharacterized protein
VDKTNKSGQFIITGSQNMLMNHQVSQSLAGRASIIKLLPFCMEELEKYPDQPSEYVEFIYKGFYPRIFDMKLNPTEWYSNYVQTYIERDVRQLKNITDLGLFQKFLRLCAGRTGQMVNYSSLANDVGVSHHTIRSWLSILEMSYIIYFLRPYYNNYNKRLVKMPKLYFYDTGLLCYLLNINNINQVEIFYLKGALFENMILSEIIKCYYNANKDPRVFFWRDKVGHEIDCIIETDKLIALEMKSGKTIGSEFFNNLNYWNNLSKSDKENSYLIYGGVEHQTRESGKVVSWKKIYRTFNKLIEF